MTPIELEHLATVSGGIWYGETKSPTGESLAAGFDSGVKWVHDRIPGEFNKAAFTLSTLTTVGVTEWGLRKAGAAWDYMRGSKP